MNSDLINALFAAGTSLTVVVLSQLLIHIKDRNQLREKMDAVLKEYFNPMRFMLSENYFLISQIVSEAKREESEKIINRKSFFRNSRKRGWGSAERDAILFRLPICWRVCFPILII